MKTVFLATDENSLTGTLPTQLGLLTNLINLEVDVNPELSGSLPTELGRLTKLTELDLGKH